MRHRSIVRGILAVLGVGVALAAAGSPVCAADRSYAVVNLSKIFNDYEKTKLYDKKLQEAQDKYQKEREIKVQALKEAQNRMALLKEEEQKKAREEVDKLRADLMAFDQAQQTELMKMRDEWFREILLEIEKTVSDFAKKEGYELIFNNRFLMYGDPSLDVSDRILNILNENYKKSNQ